MTEINTKSDNGQHYVKHNRVKQEKFASVSVGQYK